MSNKKEFTEQERFEIAQTIHGLLGLDDIDAKEEQAIYDALHIISPEFAEALDEHLQAMEDDFYVMRITDMLKNEQEDE